VVRFAAGCHGASVRVGPGDVRIAIKPDGVGVELGRLGAVGPGVDVSGMGRGVADGVVAGPGGVSVAVRVGDPMGYDGAAGAVWPGVDVRAVGQGAADGAVGEVCIVACPWSSTYMASFSCSAASNASRWSGPTSNSKVTGGTPVNPVGRPLASSSSSTFRLGKETTEIGVPFGTDVPVEAGVPLAAGVPVEASVAVGDGVAVCPPTTSTRLTRSPGLMPAPLIAALFPAMPVTSSGSTKGAGVGVATGEAAVWDAGHQLGG